MALFLKRAFFLGDESMSKLTVEENNDFYKFELNNPRKLNVLDEEMVDSFQEALSVYDKEANGLPYVISGCGDKGFCAGGDVVSVVKGIKEGKDFDFFFKKEYELDLRIHNNSNNYALAHGIVMGGGLGLFMGCETKLLDPNSTMAMPEVTIGFYPDVGASYFLQKIPKRWRLFMTLTGARLSAYDFYHLGLSDGFWSYQNGISEKSLNHKDFTETILSETGSEHRASFEEKHHFLEPIERLNNIEEFDQWCKSISLNKNLNPWVLSSISTYQKGSPISKVLIWDLFDWCVGKSIKNCFDMDLLIAKIACEKGDFYEGVRALLIDKDKSPIWLDFDLESAKHRLSEDLKVFS
jgi:enoyl-CoA hydratase/carnithine racemase